MSLKHFFLALILVLLSLFTFASDLSDDPIETLLDTGQYAQVIERLSHKPEKSMREYRQLVDAMLTQDLDAAEALVEQLIEEKSGEYRAFLLHASVMGAQAGESIFSALGYAKKAKHSLIRATELAPNNVTAHKALQSFHLAAPSIAGGDLDLAKQQAETISQLDPVAGKFAMAAYLNAIDKSEQAITLVRELASHPDTNTQFAALYWLGQHHFARQHYATANDYYVQAVSVELNLSALDEAEARMELATNQLASMYAIGRTALELSDRDALGINALTNYIDKFADAAVSRRQLPPLAWARLRFTQLLINNDEIDRARTQFASIEKLLDEEFTKVYKTVQKQLG